MAVEAMLKRIRMYFRSTFVRYMLSYVLIMMLLMGCVMAIADPTPENAAWPTWYLVYSYLAFMAPLVIVVCYLMLDRRPLRRVVPALARLTVRRELRVGLLVILGLFAAWVVASLIALV